MARTRNTAAILALGLAVSYAAVNSAHFLGFALHADTLYPALLIEELRADLSALWRFQPSRVPSFIPDLAIAGLIDAITGSWRLGFWGYAALAFALLSLLGGWIGRAIFGAWSGLWLALILAALVVLGLLQQAYLVARGVAPADLPASLHVMLMMPVWQSGAFIAGLAVLALAWRARQQGGWGVWLGLGLLTALASASNTIVVAHAVLPALIAVADAVLRRSMPRPVAWRMAAVLVLGAGAGFALGLVSGRAPLPGGGAGLAEALRALAPDLLREPQQALMLLFCLPVALALFRPRRAAAWLPQAGHPDALRFFLVVAASACGASIMITALLYGGPHTWRYANPIAWWPAIFLAGMLAARWQRAMAGIAAVAAAGIAGISALAGGAAAPALMHWRPPELVCLDAADPDVTLRAGLAAYWHARTMAAASGWRRQVESLDFGEGRPFLWIEDSRSLVQARHAPRGTPPAYRFILMTGLDRVAIERIHGTPTRILPCGATSLWLYPEGWSPLDRLVAMADPVVPHALAIGQSVCTGAERLDTGRVFTLPPGRWRLALHHGQGGGLWRILSEPEGIALHEQRLAAGAGRAEAILGSEAGALRVRILLQPEAGIAPVLDGLSINAVDEQPSACTMQRG
ncbi:MAG: hypothetical protein NTW56_08830 [Alphaproteobacteria bacterium]|nr:hypothetical protein [Alphaproteobacteria bacterium]